MTKSRAPDPFPIFTRNGVPDGMWMDRDTETAANELIEKLKRIRKSGARRGHLKERGIGFLTYALIVSQTRAKRAPLSEDHLRLLAEVLKIGEVPDGVAEYVGLPRAINNQEAFNRAADIWASEPTIGDSELARAVGVDRKTIPLWKKDPAFRGRARFQQYLNGNPTDEDRATAAMWDKWIAKLNK
jgi:hypothetical protein